MFLKYNLLKYFTIIRRIIFLWARTQSYPKHPKNFLKLDPSIPVCYVLPKYSISDLFVLDKHCKQWGLPRPLATLTTITREKAAYLHLGKSYKNREKAWRVYYIQVKQLVNFIENNNNELQLVPVSIFWGRNPGKSRPTFLELLFYDNEKSGFLRRLFTFFVHGRHILCSFGKPFLYSDMKQQDVDEDEELQLKKLRRMLKIHFKQQRVINLGPNLYDREFCINFLLRNYNIQQIIKSEARKLKIPPDKVYKKAREYALEMISDFSHNVVLIVSRWITWLLGKIYSKINIYNEHRLSELDKDCEIIYLPCHKSHIDYLLLGNLIYKYGLVLPHTASGVNLNFWPIGPILRKGGAFFIRRKFVNNRLYKKIFEEYIKFLIQRGYPISFYIEGSRSRTGQLLKPRTGLLSAIYQAYIEKKAKDILFVPIYIGYDQILEGVSFLKELRGGKKDQESFRGFFKARSVLRKQTGNCYVNIGIPFRISKYINKNKAPNIYIKAECNSIATEAMTRINQACVVTPIALFSTILLASPNRALNKNLLLEIYTKLYSILELCKYDENIVLPEKDSLSAFSHIQKHSPIKGFSSHSHDVIYVNEKATDLLKFHKNNIIHLFAIPSVISRIFEYNYEMNQKDLLDQCLFFYQFLNKQLFLKWGETESYVVFKDQLNLLLKLGLLLKHKEDNKIKKPHINTAEYFVLKLVGKIASIYLQIYSLFILEIGGSINKEKLDIELFRKNCLNTIERFNSLNGEDIDNQLFDRSYQGFISVMLKMQVIESNNNYFSINANNFSKIEKFALNIVSYDTKMSFKI